MNIGLGIGMEFPQAIGPGPVSPVAPALTVIPTLWHRASTGDYTLGAGVDVITWDDKTINGNDADQSVFGDRPELLTTLPVGGEDCIQFSRAFTRSFDYATTISIAGAYEVWYLHWAAPGENWSYHSLKSGGENYAFLKGSAEGAFIASAGNFTKVVADGSITPSAWKIIRCQRDASNNIKVWENDVDITDGAQTRTGTIVVNSLCGNANYPSSVHIADTFLFNGAVLSSGNASAMYAYFNARYGI